MKQMFLRSKHQLRGLNSISGWFTLSVFILDADEFTLVLVFLT